MLLEVKGVNIPCTLIHSSRAKYLRLQSSSLKGLELIVPRGISPNTVSRFIREHEDWILKKVSVPQSEFLLFGKELQVSTKVSPSLNHFIFTKSPGSLNIEGPIKSSTSLQKLFDKWLYLEGRDYLVKRTMQLASGNGFRINRVTVRRQTSRWGSCSHKKNISLNYRLMKYPEEIIDYVIFHELCHLVEMNHSQKFWNLVGRYVPDYKEYRKILKNPF